MTRRGIVLMELLVSMAIFVGAAMLTLSVVQSSYENLFRAHQRQFAVDLARSKMAELEAGLIGVADLSNELVDQIGSIELFDALSPLSDPAAEEWLIDIQTQRTEFAGLTLVELSVFHGDDPDTALATLRQLVQLRDALFEEYEEDELLEGLPEGGP